MVRSLLPHYWNYHYHCWPMVNPDARMARFSLPPLDIDPEGAVLLFDKPYQCTSFYLVNKIKKDLRSRFQKKIKVGHAGTLDPLATGALIVCTGKCTKDIAGFQLQEKEYTGTIRLGATTLSFDREKPVDREYPYLHITEEQLLKEIATGFTGEIEQVPPQFSAVRIAGKRAFDYARSGEEVEIKPKNIKISEFQITRFSLPEIDFRIVCSKGTYIRSIARDLGIALQSGGYLTQLRRTRIGDFKVENALQCLIET